MATTLIQVRRGTEAEWSAANPVLAATQASLDATDALVASMATQLSLDATDALVALKAPIDDPTFTTGITTPKIEVQSNGTIQGKDVVGNNTLKLRTIGDSDLSIEPAGTGIVQISTDVNLASGKEFKVDGVALATGMTLRQLPAMDTSWRLPPTP